MDPKFASDIDTLIGLFLSLCTIATLFLKIIVIMAQNKKPIAVNVYVSSPVTYQFLWFYLNKN